MISEKTNTAPLPPLQPNLRKIRSTLRHLSTSAQPNDLDTSLIPVQPHVAVQHYRSQKALETAKERLLALEKRPVSEAFLAHR
jgi:hypothetical protein